MLIKKLKYISMSNELLIYKDITIYHYSKSFDIPLLILDQKRGIYLFEYKEWSYDELKKSTIKKAHKQLKNRDTLAFEESQDVIRQQLFKLTQNDDIKIYNYLLMQNLNEQEYEHLDDSFKELLPKDKIMFNNSSNEDILKKLQDVSKPIETLPSASKIISALLVQYSIVDHDKTLQLATCEQMKFIDAKLSNHITLNAKVGSGKTSSILLKEDPFFILSFLVSLGLKSPTAALLIKQSHQEKCFLAIFSRSLAVSKYSSVAPGGCFKKVGPESKITLCPMDTAILAISYPILPVEGFEINLTGSIYSLVGPADIRILRDPSGFGILLF